MVESQREQRVLLITSWFPADVGRRGLMNELADAVVAAGAEIDVIAIDWRDVDITPDPAPKQGHPGLKVYRFKPLIVTKLGKFTRLVVKWIGTPLKAASTTFRLLRTNEYDVIVSGLPSSVWAPVLICFMFSRTKKYLVQWDFLPYHQRAMGLLTGGPAFHTLLLLERLLIRGFDVIGCMSPMNIEFLRAHYWIGSKQRVEILPIWTEAIFPEKIDRKEIRTKYNLPQNMKIAVFGGTLSKGRGLDDIFAAARHAAAQSSPILFLIIGRGPLEEDVRSKAAELSNVKVMSAIPKHEYLNLLCACDFGIVATQRETGVPTFPHKTLDYFRAGIPVVASVEDSTDFGEFLDFHNAGTIVDAGNSKKLLESVIQLCGDKTLRDELVSNGRKLIVDYFNANKIVAKILNS
jgi:glycosyltransferase involved in cell wall biosynthesis